MGGYTSKCEKKSKSLHPNVEVVNVVDLKGVDVKCVNVVDLKVVDVEGVRRV